MVKPAPDAPEKPDVPDAKESADKKEAKDSDDVDISKDPAAAAVLKALPCKVEDWQCWAKLADAENAKAKSASKNAIAKNLKPSAPGAPPNGGVTTTVPSTPPAPGSTAPSANTAPASTHVGPDAAALAALEREELDDLTKRATKAATGLESVRATREAQGQHLPTDIDARATK